MELTEKIMYEASFRKDSTFEGIFWMGVKTTGIFCRPTCTARKPKFENVEFFSHTKEALLKGYRPCKVCKPLEMLNVTPLYVKELLQEISDDPSLKLKDFDLVKRGLEPATVRRWFLKYHGVTFHAFQRMSKLNTAFKKLQQGELVTEVAFDSGYESLSGFNESFKNIFGVSPSHNKNEKIIDLKRIETMLGTMVACAMSREFAFWSFLTEKHCPRN